jgi:hypothetical protein
MGLPTEVVTPLSMLLKNLFLSSLRPLTKLLSLASVLAFMPICSPEGVSQLYSNVKLPPVPGPTAANVSNGTGG